MDLALLRTFVTVHRAGSFTRAAALLGLSQPAVTCADPHPGAPAGAAALPPSGPRGHPHDRRRRARPQGRPAPGRPGGDHRGRPRRGVRPSAPSISPGRPSSPPLRALPALTPLIAQGLALRGILRQRRGALEGLAAGHHDLAITTARPRGGLLTADPALRRGARPGRLAALGARLGAAVAAAQGRASCWSSCPWSRSTSPCRSSPATGPPSSTPGRAAAGTVIAPDLRAVLECARRGRGARRAAALSVPDALEQRRGRGAARPCRAAAAHLLPGRPDRHARPAAHRAGARVAAARRGRLVSRQATGRVAQDVSDADAWATLSHDRTTRGQAHRPRHPARRRRPDPDQAHQARRGPYWLTPGGGVEPDGRHRRRRPPPRGGRGTRREDHRCGALLRRHRRAHRGRRRRPA